MVHPTRRALLATIGLAATPAFAQAPPRRGGTLRVSVDQAPASLNPLLAQTTPEHLLAELLYSALTRLTPDMIAEPDLAHAWSADPTLTEWTFRLRPGLFFHGGAPCTARDVAASLAAIAAIAEVAATDPLTAVIRLHAPAADLPVTLAAARIVPANGGREQLARTANGTGPFRLQSFDPARVTVVRNERYWDAPHPHLDQIELLVEPDPAAAATSLLRGDTDLLPATPPGQYGRLASAPGVNAPRVPTGRHLAFDLGCDRPPFDDLRVRQALALALDREALVHAAAEGYGLPGNDTPINPVDRYRRTLPQRRPDPARARALLAEAGHPNGLDLVLAADPRLGTALRDMAAPAGFRIALQATSLAPLAISLHPGQSTPGAAFARFTSASPQNTTGWRNREFDALIHEASTNTGEPRRTALYAQAQTLLHDQVPSLVPVFFDRLAARRSWVQTQPLHPHPTVFRLDQAWLSPDAQRRS